MISMSHASGVRRLVAVAAVLAALGLPHGNASAQAETFPTKPIRFIVPYVAGGNTDVVARALAQKIQESIGQAIIVENRPGASEVIGTDVVAKAPPDGYVIGLVSSTMSSNIALGVKTPYDVNKDLMPLTGLVGVPMVLVVPAQAPYSTLAEVVAAAKANPGKLNYVSFGPSSLHKVSTEWLQYVAGIKMTEIPYKSSGPAFIGVATNEVQVMFTGLGAGLAQIQGGKLKPIAVSTAKRIGSVPAVPAVAETYPQFDVLPWYGLVAPARTPPEVVRKLNAEFVKALSSPDIQQRFVALGMDPMPLTPQAFGDFLRKDIDVWGRMVKATGAKAE